MKRTLLIILMVLTLLTLLAIIFINLHVGSYSTDRIFNDVNNVSAEDRIAIVLGARTRNGEAPDMLYDRVVTAVELYRSGRTRKLLMSGGGEEPEVMKKLAVRLGVPETDIVLDNLGLSTYDSCVRAKQVFEITSAIVVTQDFHLSRSLYLCRAIGIDTIGVNAKRRIYQAEGFGWNREYFARVGAWYDINFASLPPAPTEQLPITQ